MKITKRYGRVIEHELDDFRFTVKKMAALLPVHTLSKSDPVRVITEKVRDGRVTFHELTQWYPRALKLSELA